MGIIKKTDNIFIYGNERAPKRKTTDQTSFEYATELTFKLQSILAFGIYMTIFVQHPNEIDTHVEQM